MNRPAERSARRDVAHAHRNHEQRAEKRIRRWRRNLGQAADGPDCERERKSQNQLHINTLQRCSSPSLFRD